MIVLAGHRDVGIIADGFEVPTAQDAKVRDGGLFRCCLKIKAGHHEVGQMPDGFEVCAKDALGAQLEHVRQRW